MPGPTIYLNHPVAAQVDAEAATSEQAAKRLQALIERGADQVIPP